MQPVFERRDQKVRFHIQLTHELLTKASRIIDAEAVIALLIGKQGFIAPQRRAIGPPETAQRPARQRFAGIPLAFAVVQQPTGRERILQAFEQHARAFALVNTECLGVPLRAFHVVNGHKRRLTAHRQSDIQL